MRFTLRLNIVNHCDINILAFYYDYYTNFMINIYSDSNQTALQVLLQSAINLDNTIIIIGDFNIRDSNWDCLTYHHSIHTNDLLTIADSLGLKLSPPLNLGPTRFIDNPHDSNFVIDLVFLLSDNLGFGKHILHPKIWKPSDHVPLTIEIGIKDINIDINKWSVRKDSKEEKSFITSIINSVKNLDTASIETKEDLENSVQQLAVTFEHAWYTHSKLKHIMKYSKEW